MSHFYGTLQGNKGEATRCGSKSSGVDAVAASWRGCGTAFTYFNEERGVDMLRLAIDVWKGAGMRAVLYDGPVDPRTDPSALLESAQAAVAYYLRLKGINDQDVVSSVQKRIVKLVERELLLGGL
jgi:hypothetical protein